MSGKRQGDGNASAIALQLKKSMQISFQPLKRVTAFFLFLVIAISFSQAQVSVLPPNSLVSHKQGYDTRFQWYGDTVNGRWEPHSALLIPVSLPGCRETFFMQFDLGAPYSLFYRNKLQSIVKKYPAALRVNDTTHTLNAYRFKIGTRSITATSIMVKQFDSSGINWKDKQKIIGTLGADLIEDKVLLIDYPGLRIQITDSIGRKWKELQWHSFMFARRSVLLPAVIKGKKTMLYFDTGSSAFELLTDKATCLSLAEPGTIPAQYPVNSWGKTLLANTVASRDSIAIGGQQLPIHEATFIEGTSDTQVQQMMKMGIGGMTGNTLFLKYVLILDTRRSKFALLMNP